MLNRLHVVATIALLAALSSACSDAPPPSATEGLGPPVFADAQLQRGRELWLANCQACHGSGLAGAPRLGDRSAWAVRLDQGMDTLFEHALHGYSGPTGTEMPARGGNEQLSDEEVKAAVQYMAAASR